MEATLPSPADDGMVESVEKEATLPSPADDGTWVLEKEFCQRDGPGKLVDARGITVNPTTEDVAVADPATHTFGKVKVYNKDGEYRFSLGTTQGLTSGRSSSPWDVTASDEGIYYVTDTTQYVKMYDAEGVYHGKWVQCLLIANPLMLSVQTYVN